MFYASLGAMSVVLDVICFLGRPLRCFGIVAWSTVLWVDGSERGILPRFRDNRYMGLLPGRSDTLVESGVRRLCRSRYVQAGECWVLFRKLCAHTICGAIDMKRFYVLQNLKGFPGFVLVTIEHPLYQPPFVVGVRIIVALWCCSPFSHKID